MSNTSFKHSSSPANRLSDADRLGVYLYYRQVMSLFSEILLLEQTSGDETGPDVTSSLHHKKKFSPTEIADYVRDINPNLDPLTISTMHKFEQVIPGSQGFSTRVQFVDIQSKDSDPFWIMRAQTIRLDEGGPGSYGRKVVIRRSPDGGHYAETPDGVKITDAFTFGGHQTFGLQAVQQAEQQWGDALGLVMATGTGKSFVLIAPAIAAGKGGVFSVPNETQINQLVGDIKALDVNVDDDQITTSAEIPRGQEAKILLDHVLFKKPKYILIKHDDLGRFIDSAPESVFKGNPQFSRMSPDEIADELRLARYFIDEAHEADLGAVSRLLERQNKVLAVTATWTEALQKIFSDPIATLNMHYALNMLRAFRNILINAVDLPKTEDEDELVFDIMADYYGSLTYIERDNTSEGDKKFVTLDKLKDRPDLLNDGIGALLDKIIDINEVRRFDHMNMAFTKNPVLLEKLAAGYQGVFNGTYERLDELTEKVSAMRTERRIRELWKLEYELTGIGSPPPNQIDIAGENIQRRFGNLIEKFKMKKGHLQDETHMVLRTKIAEVMTRQVAAILLDATPNLMRADQVSGDLHKKLLAISESPEDHRDLLDSVARDTHPTYRRIAEILAPLKDEVKETILNDISAGRLTSLIIDEKLIDLDNFPEASYATLAKPGDNKGAAAIAARMNKGWHVHVVGDSELATGYSNPDIMSVQRIILNVIPGIEGITRAVQMLGRAIRAKDLVAFATDFLGRNVSKDGELGRKGGRPFLLSDVVSPHYDQTVERYVGAAHPQPQPG